MHSEEFPYCQYCTGVPPGNHVTCYYCIHCYLYNSYLSNKSIDTFTLLHAHTHTHTHTCAHPPTHPPTHTCAHPPTHTHTHRRLVTQDKAGVMHCSTSSCLTISARECCALPSGNVLGRLLGDFLTTHSSAIQRKKKL